MTETQDRLNKIAHFAASKGLQVTFATRTVTEGSQAGRTLREITISAYEDEQPRPLPVLPITIAGYVFAKDEAVEGRWIASGPDGESLFELTNQPYFVDANDEEVDDWGIYDLTGNDWAHEPLETGYGRKVDAVKSFVRWLEKNN